MNLVQFELIVGAIYLFLVSRSIHRKLNEIKKRLDLIDKTIAECIFK